MILFIFALVQSLRLPVQRRVTSKIHTHKHRHHQQQIQSGQPNALKVRVRNSHYQFLAILQVNGYKYKPLVDTGSISLVLKGYGCKGVPQQKLNCYDCPYKGGASITYADGSISGSIVEVNAIIQDKQIKMDIILADYCFDSFTMQGILGLFYQKDQQTSIVKQLKDQGMIKEAIIVIRFKMYQKYNNYIDFGQIDYSQVKWNKQGMFYAPLIGYLYTIHGKSLYFNGFKSGYQQFQILIDTGNSALSLPKSTKNLFLKAMPKSAKDKCHTVDQRGISSYQILVCINLTKGQLQDMPQIEMILDSGDIIHFSYLEYMNICGQRKQDDNYSCSTNIQFKGLGADRITLGLPFFSRYLVQLDPDNKRVGIGPFQKRNNFESLLQDYDDVLDDINSI